MKKSQNIANLEKFAASQWGMFTTAQAQELGVRRNQIARMVDADRAEMVSHGVYRLTAGDETESLDIKGAWLSVYPKESAYDRLKKRPYDAVVAGRTAAFMHGAGGFYSSPYTFAVTRRKQTSRDEMKYLVREVREDDVVFIDSLPVTDVERTIYDLIRSHEDPDLVDKFISDVSRIGDHAFDLEHLAGLLASLAARNGFGEQGGDAFAADLVSRNAIEFQIKRATDAMSRTLLSTSNQERIKCVQEQMRTMAKTIVGNEPFTSQRELARKLQESFAGSEAVRQLQESARKIVLPATDSLSGIQIALRNVDEINALKSGNWNNLASHIVASLLPSADDKGGNHDDTQEDVNDCGAEVQDAEGPRDGGQSSS